VDSRVREKEMIECFIDGNKIKVSEEQLKAAEQSGMLIRHSGTEEVPVFAVAPQHKEKIAGIMMRAWQEHRREITLPVDPVAPEPRVTEAPVEKGHWESRNPGGQNEPKDWCVRAARMISCLLMEACDDRLDPAYISKMATIIRQECKKGMDEALEEIRGMPLPDPPEITRKSGLIQLHGGNWLNSTLDPVVGLSVEESLSVGESCLPAKTRNQVNIRTTRWSYCCSFSSLQEAETYRDILAKQLNEGGE
jgi:hypothetical protein